MTISQASSVLYGSSAGGRHATFASLRQRLLATDASTAPLAARVALGLILFPHGAQHALGWFGGYGFSGTLGWMTGPLGFPAPLAAVGIVTELVAPLVLIAGAGGRIAAGLLFVHMAFAASTHLENGFFMNWFGALKPGAEGFEYHLLTMALALVVVIAGSGRFSLDRLLAGQSTRPALTSAVS